MFIYFFSDLLIMNTTTLIHDDDHSILDMDKNNKDLNYHRKYKMARKKFILGKK